MNKVEHDASNKTPEDDHNFWSPNDLNTPWDGVVYIVVIGLILFLLVK